MTMSDVNMISVGPEYATRWIIKNEHDYYWNGTMWIPEKEKALKFHDRAEAENQIFEFENNPLKKFNMWKYEGVVEVETFSMEKPDLDELIKHMWGTHLLDFFHDDQGPNGAWILPFIKWDTLREW